MLSLQSAIHACGSQNHYHLRDISKTNAIITTYFKDLFIQTVSTTLLQIVCALIMPDLRVIVKSIYRSIQCKFIKPRSSICHCINSVYTVYKIIRTGSLLLLEKCRHVPNVFSTLMHLVDLFLCIVSGSDNLTLSSLWHDYFGNNQTQP